MELLSVKLFIVAVFFDQLEFFVANCEDGGGKFKPIVEDTSFKLSFRLKFMKNGHLSHVSEVYEQYHHNLSASNVWEIKVKNGDTKKSIKRFLYDPRSGTDLVVEGEQEDGPGELLLDENGGSSWYELNEYQKEQPNVLSILPKASSLDSTLLNSGENQDDNFNLDAFFPRECIDKVNQKLKHIRGLSRLLLLIECRRSEFARDTSNWQLPTGAGLRTKLYKCLFRTGEQKSVSKLAVSVSYQETHSTKTNSDVPPERSIPQMIILEYKNTKLVVNLYQFEIVNDSAELSSWGSIFMLPVASGFADFPPEPLKSNVTQKPAWNSEFSFKALLTGPEYSQVYADPIELSVVFDGPAKMMARETIILDRSVSLINRWKERRSRSVYDAKSNLKYHIESSSDLPLESLSSPAFNSAEGTREESWTSCVPSGMIKEEKSQLMKERDFFGLEGAVFLGVGVVRGIACYVYERRIWSLPFLLGFGLDLNSGTLGDKIYLTYFLAGAVKDKENGKLLRMVVTVKTKKGSLQSRYNFEIYSFDWSSKSLQSSSTADQSSLFEIAQECLYSDPSLAYVNLDLLFKTDQMDSGAGLKLEEDERYRNRIVSNAIEESFGVTRDQQANLESSFFWDRNSSNPQANLDVKLTVFKLPTTSFVADFIKAVEDLGRKSYEEQNKWSVGTSRMSFEECKWLSAHTLYSNSATPDYNKRDEQTTRMFMFCPNTLHCVLGDSSWSSAVRKEVFTIESIMSSTKVNSKSSNDNQQQCHVYSMRMISLGADTTKGFSLISNRKEKTLQQVPVSLRLADDKVVQTRVIKEMTSRVFKTSAPGELPRQLAGLGYVEPSEEAIVKVNSVAKCSNLCSLEHDCHSYSICHNQAGFDCLLTRVNLTDADKLKELKMIDRKGEEGKRIRVAVQLSESGEVDQLELRVDSGCSLHFKSHYDVFKFMEKSIMAVPSNEYALIGDDVNQCAKLCMQRADLIGSIRELTNKTFNELTTEACFSFEFNEESGLCLLRPTVKMGAILDSIDGEKVKALDGKARLLLQNWNNSFGRAAARSANSNRFWSSINYGLNYEHLFLPKRRQRFELTNIGSQIQSMNSSNEFELSEKKLQITFTNTPINKCAHLCFLWNKCKSFDIYISIEAEERPNLISCRLNAASYEDISDDARSGLFQVVAQKENGRELGSGDGEGNWWHYEPSELALYLMGFVLSSWPSLPSDKHQEQYSAGIFIESARGRSSSRRERGRADELNKTDWSKAAGKWKGGLWFMVSIVFIMLLVVIVYFVTRLSKSNASFTQRRFRARSSLDRRELLA